MEQCGVGDDPPPMERAGSSGNLASCQAFPPSKTVLQKFVLYETCSRYYVVGCPASEKYFKVIKIERTDPAELRIVEDNTAYSRSDLNRLLAAISAGNKHVGGLSRVTTFYGIVGCIRFLFGYYLLIVTKRTRVGRIGGHDIFSVNGHSLLQIHPPSSSAFFAGSPVEYLQAESRYKNLFAGMKLNKNFYFSYTYDLSRTVQANLRDPRGSEENMFVWNTFLQGNIFEYNKLSRQWLISLVHGFFKQELVSCSGRMVSIGVVARRSRMFAGTRYLKRGVNNKGQVANDVEVEQIVIDETMSRFGPVNSSCVNPIRLSAVVQNRGSIPLFWTQEGSLMAPKPPIVMLRFDPFFVATKKHYLDLIRRYGDLLIILNLTKQTEKTARETILRGGFEESVSYTQSCLKGKQTLQYLAWDFNRAAKNRGSGGSVLDSLTHIAANLLDQTKILLTYRRKAATGEWATADDETEDRDKGKPMGFRRRDNRTVMQRGVVRTNCIDCLDRTNVAQFCIGHSAFGHQLYELGLQDSDKLGFDSPLSHKMMDIYEQMGDRLALQYGGSQAHKVAMERRKSEARARAHQGGIGVFTGAASKSVDLLTSIKRHYTNTFTDNEKQGVINLFLGAFIPNPRKPNIWELDSDTYLHHNDELEDLEDAAESQSEDEHIDESIAEADEICDYFESVHNGSRMTSFDEVLGDPFMSMSEMAVGTVSQDLFGANFMGHEVPVKPRLLRRDRVSVTRVRVDQAAAYESALSMPSVDMDPHTKAFYKEYESVWERRLHRRTRASVSNARVYAKFVDRPTYEDVYATPLSTKKYYTAHSKSFTTAVQHSTGSMYLDIPRNAGSPQVEKFMRHHHLSHGYYVE